VRCGYAFRVSVVFLLAAGAAWAVPQLRLSNTVIAVSVPVNAATATQVLDAFNIGDGSLSLSIAVQAAAT